MASARTKYYQLQDSVPPFLPSNAFVAVLVDKDVETKTYRGALGAGWIASGQIAKALQPPQDHPRFKADEFWCIPQLYVLPHIQRQGHGAELVRQLRELAGNPPIFLDIRADEATYSIAKAFWTVQGARTYVTRQETTEIETLVDLIIPLMQEMRCMEKWVLPPAPAQLVEVLQQIVAPVLEEMALTAWAFPLLGQDEDAKQGVRYYYFGKGIAAGDGPTRYKNFKDMVAKNAKHKAWRNWNDFWTVTMTGKCDLNAVVATFLDRWLGDIEHKGVRVQSVSVASVEARNLVPDETDRVFVYPKPARFPCRKPLPSEWCDRLLRTTRHRVLIIGLANKERLVFDLSAAQYGLHRCDLKCTAPIVLMPLKEASHIVKILEDSVIEPFVWRSDLLHGNKTSKTAGQQRMDALYKEYLEHLEQTLMAQTKCRKPLECIVLR